MKSPTALLLVMSISAIAFGEAWPQDRKQLGGRIDRDVLHQLHLLTLKPVQEDLNLSENQIKKTREMQDKQDEMLRSMRGLSREERLAKIKEHRKDAEKLISEILDTRKANRLVQISLQMGGGNALADKDVAEQLKLTDEQKEQVKTIRADGDRVRSEALASLHNRLTGGKGGQLDEETRKKTQGQRDKIVAENRKATDEKLLSILTQEQKAKWKEMTGEPFKGKSGTIIRRQSGSDQNPRDQ